MLIRILLGYILALPVVVPLIAQSIGTLQPFTVSVTMQARLPGHLQVFYDDGRGFSEPRSAVVRLQVSEEPRQYTLDLPSGRYRAFRIDPRTLGGQYVIERVEILAPDGSTYISFPLLSLVPAGPTTVTEKSATRLTVNAAPGPNDLQLLYVPDVPVTIPVQPFTPLALGLLARVMFLWLCGILGVWVGERATNRWLSVRMQTISTLAGWCLRAPRITVCVTAVLATLVATYPVLLFGRSLVSPNNHGLMLLYETPPFAPGSSDLLLEDIRGSDVGAALYQDIPHSNVQREALVHGEVPLWNRYNADGRPLWAQGLTYLADPLHWLTLVTPDPSLGWDLKFVIHRFVFSLGVGFAAMATAGGWLPGVIGAVAAAFGGIYAYRLNHPTIFVLTYAPWALLAWFKLAAATDLRRQAFAAIQIALFTALILFASIPKDAAMTLVGVWSTGVLGLLLSRGSWRDCGRRLVGAALAAVATVLITMPHWLPFLDTLKQSFTAYDTPLALFGGRPLAIGFFLSPLNPGPFEPGLHMLALVPRSVRTRSAETADQSTSHPGVRNRRRRVAGRWTWCGARIADQSATFRSQHSPPLRCFSYRGPSAAVDLRRIRSGLTPGRQFTEGVGRRPADGDPVLVAFGKCPRHGAGRRVRTVGSGLARADCSPTSGLLLHRSTSVAAGFCATGRDLRSAGSRAARRSARQLRARCPRCPPGTTAATGIA